MSPAIRTVWCPYCPDGNVSNITIWDGGDVSKDLYLIYGTNGTLWLAVWQEWQGAGVPNEWDITVTDAWEFRYDTGRQRYLARRWQYDWQTGFTPDPNTPATWTDYLGPQPYVDYTVDEGDPSEVMRYLAGFGVHAQGSAGVPPAGGPVFLHGDLTRSTMMTTTVGAGGGGTGVSPVVAYTAFGDPVAWDSQSESWRVGWPVDMGTRYQYDGGWGYESGLITLFGEDETLPPVTLQHVGWRWYQPSLGRFVQRDPIGLAGGLNVYAYALSSPLTRIDPSGLSGQTASGEIIAHTLGAGAGSLVGLIVASGIIAISGPPGWVAAGITVVCVGMGGAAGYDIGGNIYNSPDPSGSSSPSAPPPEPRSPVPPTCLVEGTLVWVNATCVPIELFRPGDSVDSRASGETTVHSSAVRAARTGLSYETVEIMLEHESIRCTKAHPFWVAGKGWTAAGHLMAGDQLETADGAPITIVNVAIECLCDPVRVYDITVDDTHTYFVGESRVLVHNKVILY